MSDGHTNETRELNLDAERLGRALTRAERIANTDPGELLWVRDAIDILTREDVPALVAEVRRLRDALDLVTTMHNRVVAAQPGRTPNGHRWT